MVAARGIKAQAGYLAEAERHIEGSFVIPADRTDYDDRATQFCSDYSVSGLHKLSSYKQHRHTFLIYWVIQLKHTNVH